MDFINATEDKWSRLYEKYGEAQGRRPEKNGGKLKWVLIIIVAIAVISVVLFYFFGLPQLVSKPDIENPRAGGGAEAYNKFIDEDAVTIEDVTYLSNEMGSYILRSDIISGEKPEIELVVEDTNQTFAIVIENKMPIVSLGDAENPDIRVIGDKETIAQILFSEPGGIKTLIVELYNNDRVEVILLKSEEVLISKGYKAIYDEILSA